VIGLGGLVWLTHGRPRTDRLRASAVLWGGRLVVTALVLSLAGGIIRDVQRQGGYVTGGHRGRAIPARLEITAIAHNHVPDQTTMRLHTHIYVGRTDVTSLMNPSASPVLKSDDEARWVAFEMRRAMR
jgi:hypothetical protein